ncbi:hypothetical protein J3R83DRAFT_5304 [Lanmaoa asiatica]|nr:hypothetical protein J3R83DRAFT_5304 [Lanmaoa asiatica]
MNQEIPEARCPQDAKKYFLTVLRAEDVMIDDNTDNTLRLFHGIDVPPGCPRHNVRPEKEPSTGHVSSVPLQEEMLVRRNIYHKIHFPVVFSDLGKTIFDLKTLGDVLETLEHALKGLPSSFYNSCIGLVGVYRDTSAGNMLRCGRQRKIVDLEYAKARNSPGEIHNVRTVSFS